MALETPKRLKAAVDAVAVIAGQQRAQPVTTQLLCETTGLSVSYLEKIMRDLKLGGIVRSYRGPGGGYRLGRDMDELTVLDVYHAIHGEDDTVAPTAQDQVEPRGPLGFELEQAQEAQRFLASYTLADVARPIHEERLPSKGNRFKLKPMPAPVLPRAPRSVFDWSASMAA
jgi:Rrf2 family protein